MALFLWAIRFANEVRMLHGCSTTQPFHDLGIPCTPATTPFRGNILTMDFEVVSPNVAYTEDYITATYSYEKTLVEGNKVYPVSDQYEFRTARKVPRTGLMMVGWGGSNGSTLTAAILANKLGLSWPTKVCCLPTPNKLYS